MKDLHLFLFYFLCRLPYIVLFYPCIFDYDAAVSISSFSSGRVLSDHHPFLVACLQKLFFDLGSFIGSPSIGMAILSLLFCLVVSSGLVYTTRVLGRMGAKKSVQYAFIAIFAFSPFFSLLNLYVTKDGIWAYSMFFFIASQLEIINYYRKGQNLPVKVLFICGISALFLCFSRHQGIIFISIQCIVLIMYLKRSRVRIVLIYLPVIILHIFIVHVLYPKWGVVHSGKQEIIGNFFQQSALSFIRHPEGFSMKERRAFENLIEINLDTIYKSYNYDITDPIKFHYKYMPVIYWTTRNDCAKDNELRSIVSYFDSWKDTFIRDPISCFIAEANIVNGFFYNKGIGYENILFIDFWHKCPYLTQEYKFNVQEKFYPTTNGIFYFLSYYPFVEFVFAKCYYTWLFILGFIFLTIKKDILGIIPFLPLFLSICVFFLSPCADFRYSLPLVVNAFPLLFYLTSRMNHCMFNK